MKVFKHIWHLIVDPHPGIWRQDRVEIIDDHEWSVDKCQECGLEIKWKIR